MTTDSQNSDTAEQSLGESALNDLLCTIPRYDLSIGGGCECCGSWVEHDLYKYGDWVRFDDLEKAIKRIIGA